MRAFTKDTHNFTGKEDFTEGLGRTHSTGNEEDVQRFPHCAIAIGTQIASIRAGERVSGVTVVSHRHRTHGRRSQRGKASGVLSGDSLEGRRRGSDTLFSLTDGRWRERHCHGTLQGCSSLKAGAPRPASAGGGGRCPEVSKARFLCKFCFLFFFFSFVHICII